MAYQITGKIETIGEIISKATNNGGQPFQSRSFVLDATRFNPETGEPWENHPKFELSSRNVNIIDGFQVGQRVTVDFVLRGAKYQDKQTGETRYFTTVSAFKVSNVEQHTSTNVASDTQWQQVQPIEEAKGSSPEVPINDLPF